MKKLFITLLLLTTLRAEIASDKFAHLAVGGVIYYGCLFVGSIAQRQGYDTYLNTRTCLIPVVVIGAGKEYYDYKHPANHSAEWGDFGADMAVPLVSAFAFEIKF